MRNKYPGVCYRCGEWCKEGEGHFERLGASWRVQHASCAIKYRGQADIPRQRETVRKRQITIKRWQKLAEGEGKDARRARKRLRQAGLLPRGAAA